jgi:ribosomal protein S18 acetylase RimI-like enzyme
MFGHHTSASFWSRRVEMAGDADWAEGLLTRRLGGRMQARRGELIDVLALPGLVAEDERGEVGILLYDMRCQECELAAIVAEKGQRGVGTQLVEALKRKVSGRIWLVTTNDNLDALRFYQRRGFVLVALRSGAVEQARRRLKPTIPETCAYGIPLRDEIELEFLPSATTSH